MKYPTGNIPKMALVQQQLSTDRIHDVRTMVRDKLLAAGLRERVKPGAQVGITAGSRGMGGFMELIGGTIDALRAVGAAPFILPSMGSHGGATAEGQVELLGKFGITEKNLGVPIRSTMETDCLGTSETGAKVHLDRNAANCDGVIVLGRVKTHPENTEGIASGLLKMTTIGLGKQSGAQEAHSHGLWDSVKAVPKITFQSQKILFGIAVAENAFRQPVEIEVVPGTYDAFYDADTRLLKISKKHFARVPFDSLDLLIVDELGKNISGTGMDLNVIGPWRIKGGKKDPDYKRIVVLSLTEQSMGNGLGIGLSDFTTERFSRAFDWHSTAINMLTATEPDTRNTVEGQLPLVLANDREAIGTALYSTLAANPKVCRIESTARLDQFRVSESLLNEIREKDGLTILEEPKELAFNGAGNLF
jgi:hypothetical protein